MLAVAGLSVAFGSEPGLEDVALRVEAGERVVLVGASGAGKTSLLRAIAGFGQAARGSVTIAGDDVTRLPPERRGAVYLHQTPLLFPHMTVAENVAFPLRVRGVEASERARRAAAALGVVRLADFGSRLPHTLSGGQRHRVALARAVTAEPPVLLLDEPFAALDPTLRAEVRDALIAVQERYSPAVLLVTHDLDEAAAVGHRIGVLLDRRLAQVAAPAELLTYPATLAIARFLGGFLELDGRVDGGVFYSPLVNAAPARLHAPDGPATAVVRSDGVRWTSDGARGVVEEVRVLAGRVSVTVRAGEHRIHVTTAAGEAPQPGAAVSFRIPPELLSVYPV